MLTPVGGQLDGPLFTGVGELHTLPVIEAEADRDLDTESVRGKRAAARRWAKHVDGNDQVIDRWHYLLVGETELDQVKDDW